jgi:hypothetical protein
MWMIKLHFEFFSFLEARSVSVSVVHNPFRMPFLFLYFCEDLLINFPSAFNERWLLVGVLFLSREEGHAGEEILG